MSGILVLVVLVPVPTIGVISGFWSCFSESIIGSEDVSSLLSLFSFFLSTFKSLDECCNLESREKGIGEAAFFIGLLFYRRLFIYLSFRSRR